MHTSQSRLIALFNFCMIAVLLAALDARYPQRVSWQVTVDSLPYSQYADDNYLNNPPCQWEFMKRLIETPGLDLEAEFDR